MPSRYANSVHVMKMCAALSRGNFETRLLAMKGGETDVFNFYNVEKTFHVDLVSSFKNGIIRALNYNFVCLRKMFSHKGYVYLRYFYPLVGCLLLRKKVIIEFHNIPSGRFSKWILTKLFKSSSFVCAVFITHRLKDYYLNCFSIDKSKCLVLPDCCDIPKENNMIVKPFDIGYVGHLYEGRGFELVIEVAKRLPNSNFHIIGGRDEDISKFKAIAPINIIFYGFVDQSKLIELYKNFTIVLAPYQTKVSSANAGSDTANWMSPMKIFEYMAFKKAIILSDLPALREIGFNNEQFLYVSHNDATEWVDSILKLQNDRLFLERLINCSYRKFEDEYTWDKRVERLCDFLIK